MQNALQTHTETRKAIGRPWKPGQSGNPSGLSSTQKRLWSKTIRDVWKTWKEGGITAVRRCRDEHPDVYLRVVVSLLPKDFNINLSGEVTHNVAISEPTQWIDAVVAGYDPATITNESETKDE